ncbi:hypothetical protein F5B21DRAFT_526358 [Xylaria acuta]|nr:hypothetical protein F5B21DRAFT_526358 [Xylaria acuta]
MGDVGQVSPTKRDRRVNLDHLIISVRSRTDETTDHALNEFISREGRASEVHDAKHYEYVKFRDLLYEELKIDPVATLYPSHPTLPNIYSEASFRRCLAQMQKGEVRIPDSLTYGLPYLEFSTVQHDDSAKRNDEIPKAEDDALPGSPTRPRPPAEPVGVPDPKDIIDLTQESDPEQENPGTLIIDLTQEPSVSSVGDQAEGQGFDLSDDGPLYPEDGPTLIDQIVPREDSADDDDWKRVCDFFRCSVDAEYIPVHGMSVQLKRYQAFTVWRVFTQITDKNIPSFVIGDAPGLGKTGMSLTIAIIFAMLHTKYQAVLNYRRTAGQPKAHLEVGESGTCPSQLSPQVQGIICPCVSSGLSFKLVECIDDFPSMICVPPVLIPQWYNEAESWIDRGQNSPASHIRILIDRDEGEIPAISANDIERIRGTLIEEGTGRRRSYRLDAQPGSSANIMIVGRHATPQLLGRFRVPKPRTRSGETINSLGCGFVFFDEYHDYKGGRENITKPFEMLGTIRQMVRRVMAIGLSANVTQGPHMWRPFVDHVFNSPTRGPIPGLNNVNRLDRYQRTYSYLVQNIDREGMSDDAKREQERRQTELVEFMRVFIPHMTLARTRTSKFRGETVGSPYAPIRLKTLNMRPGETHDIFRSLASNIQAYLNQRYNEAVRDWENEGRRGEMPNKKSLANDDIRQIADGRGQNRDFSVISRASCFPYIATLYNKDSIPHESILFEGVQPIARGIGRQLHPSRLSAADVAGSINSVNELLAQSPFFQHRNELMDWSPKILWVQGYIRELLRILKTQPDTQEVRDKYGPAPTDGTNARHALVFSQAPITAFLTFMVLWNTFREDIEKGDLVLLYPSSGMSTAERAQYTDFMQQSCQNDNRCKVLVSASSIMGEGHNLQRANSVILTEVPSTYETQKQSFGRADRQGQTMTPFLYQLYDDLNLAERVKMARNKNRKRLRFLTGDETVEEPDFTQLINDQSIINVDQGP